MSSMRDLSTTSKRSPDRRKRLIREEHNGFLVVRGPAVDRIFPLYLSATTIGRDKSANICLNDGSVSRQHAQLRRTGNSFEITDLSSTNGTRVNGELGTRAILKDQDRLEIGTSVAKVVSPTSAEQPHCEETYRQPYADKALPVYNKVYFFQRLDEELYRCRRNDSTLSLLLPRPEDLYHHQHRHRRSCPTRH